MQLGHDVHERGDVDRLRAGHRAGVAADAIPDVRGLQGLPHAAQLEQPDDAVWPVGHRLGHRAAAAAALTMKAAADIGAGALDHFGDDIAMSRPRGRLYANDTGRFHEATI